MLQLGLLLEYGSKPEKLPGVPVRIMRWMRAFSVTLIRMAQSLGLAAALGWLQACKANIEEQLQKVRIFSHVKLHRSHAIVVYTVVQHVCIYAALNDAGCDARSALPNMFHLQGRDQGRYAEEDEDEVRPSTRLYFSENDNSLTV